jgi:hypothetical protein
MVKGGEGEGEYAIVEHSGSVRGDYEDFAESFLKVFKVSRWVFLQALIKARMFF